jgi:hypothetical protein
VSGEEDLIEDSSRRGSNRITGRNWDGRDARPIDVAAKLTSDMRAEQERLRQADLNTKRRASPSLMSKSRRIGAAPWRKPDAIAGLGGASKRALRATSGRRPPAWRQRSTVSGRAGTTKTRLAAAHGPSGVPAHYVSLPTSPAARRAIRCRPLPFLTALVVAKEASEMALTTRTSSRAHCWDEAPGFLGHRRTLR